MTRYFLKLAYNGSAYSGWQIQPNAKSIQEEIQEQLKKINKNKPIEIVGCGRTDAGVHASEFYAHFDAPEDLTIDQLQHKLNGMLSKHISIMNIIQVHEDAHARFDATTRTYHYFISQVKDPFQSDFHYFFKPDLDVKKMNEACKFLFKHEDFTSFSKLHTDTFTNNCSILKAEWKKTDQGYQFTITANRFLRNMVRAIVGTCMEVGLGKISVPEFNQIILAKDRNRAGTSVPGKGLFLAQITYPYL